MLSYIRIWDCLLIRNPNFIFLSLQGDNMSMETSEVECPYCGETFEGETEADARTQEGVHRAEEHVNESDSTQKASKGRNIIDDWKTEGKRA